MLVELLLSIATLSIVFVLWERRKHSYWRRHHVKFIAPSPVGGNLGQMLTMKESFATQLALLYNAVGFESEPSVGIYVMQRPALLLRDVDLIKRILTSDFTMFSNRTLRTDPHNDPLGTNSLFFARNTQWRDLRTKLTPIFTSGKVKQMYPLMAQIGRELEALLASESDGSVLDVKDVCTRFTTDLIATIAFGVRANSLQNPQSDFLRHSRAIFALTWRRALEFLLMFVAPDSLSRLFGAKVFSAETSTFLRESIAHVIAERERSGAVRNDLIDALIALKREAAAHPERPHPAQNFDFLVAQAAVFQTAGYETSSSTMTFALYELAMNPAIQERLRAEVCACDEAGDGISYEQLQSLPYLGQVIDETLRLYPIVGFLDRECTPEAGSDGYDLRPHLDFVVPPGLSVYICPLAVQRDERYWSEPLKFDPERFAPENRANINMNAYLPFGAGPRNCMGMRIGLLQTRLGLVHILKNHRVTRCEQTTPAIEFDPKSLVLSQKGGIYLRFERIEH